MKHIKTALKDEIKKINRAKGNEVDLQDNTHLFEGGLIDSFDFFQLITFIEDNFIPEVPDAYMTIEHFGTIESIANTISIIRS
jgi:acyl carrier protein